VQQVELVVASLAVPSALTVLAADLVGNVAAVVLGVLD